MDDGADLRQDGWLAAADDEKRRVVGVLPEKVVHARLGSDVQPAMPDIPYDTNYLMPISMIFGR
jgi:hypothetical protein